jgi:hypothetical protein
MILAPRRAYLDTSHWIGLSDGVLDVDAFFSAASAGAFVPTLSFAHLSDFATDHDEARRRRRGEFIDRVRRAVPLLWIQALNTIAADEIQRLYEEVILGRRGVAQRSPFFSRSVESLDYKNHGDPSRLAAAMREEDRLSATMLIESLRAAPRRPEYMAFRSDQPATMERIRVSRGRAKTFTPDEQRWFVASIVDKAKLIFAAAADRNRFIDHVMTRRDEMPALDLRIRYRQGALLTNAAAEPSDAEDYDHLAGFAYCDVAFADKRTRDVLKRGGSAKLPSANASFERWLRDEIAVVRAR